MHNTRVKLKTGEVINGPLWEWRPAEGWFSIVGNPLRKIQLADCESAVQSGVRVSINKVEDVDLLERARRQLAESKP